MGFAQTQLLTPTMSNDSNHGAVLIVDDEPALRELVARVVESVNARPIQAGDGEEALRIFQTNYADIEVIISDVNMPVMDGFTFIRAAKEIAPEVKVILSSGSLATEDQLAAVALGVTAVLPKPYTAGQLAQCVKSVLKGKQADR
jgi:two-component system, cell cycle sensor histidine kinase and response regulator CckA